MRRIATPNEFFDILDKMGDNKFVTIGYVTGANLNVPKVKRLNPQTNRMKGYDDYSTFGDEEIGALVKITSYNMRYRRRDIVAKQYGDYKNSANTIRSEYGLDPIGNKENTYKDKMNYGEQGVDLYKGGNDALQGHSYYSQNVYGVKPKSVVYCVGTDGHIIKALSQEQIIPYLKAKRETDGVAVLRKMGVEDERIKEYISKIQGLGMNYKNFEANSILWIAATVNGEKIVYINDNLARNVNDIDINPQDFIAIAKERYKKDIEAIQEQMKRTTSMRLTESQLKQIVREATNKLLSELDWRTLRNASDKAFEKASDPTVTDWERERRQNQADSFFSNAEERFRRQYGTDAIKDRREKHEKEKSLGKNVGDFKYTNGELKRLDRREKDKNDFFNGKQEYRDGRWQNKIATENRIMRVNEAFRNDQNYTHFAVNKKTGKIVNGWDYSDHNPQELRQFKKDYFDVDLLDYELDPRNYRILTRKYLIRMGIDPSDNGNWAQR